MSTDDLMTRVRDHLAHADTLPHGLAIALVSELADEVDRLQAYIDTQPHHSDMAQVEAERDAARAENERLRAAAVEARNELRWKWGQAADAAETFEAERDAARAALNRVKDELIKQGKHIPSKQDAGNNEYWNGARDAVEHTQASVHFALEEES